MLQAPSVDNATVSRDLLRGRHEVPAFIRLVGAPVITAVLFLALFIAVYRLLIDMLM